MKDDIKRVVLIVFSIGMIITTIMIFNTNLNIRENTFNNERAVEFNKGWRYYSDGKIVEIQLPVKLPVQENTPLVIFNKVPDINTEGTTMCFRTSLQSISIECNNSILYRYITPGVNSSEIAVESLWHMVRIPKKYSNTMINVKVESMYPQTSGLLNTVYLGSKTSVLYTIVKENASTFIIALTSLFMGIVLMIIYVSTVNRANYSSLFYLSFSIIFLSFWLLGESKLLQFFINDEFIVTRISYVSISVFPVPFSLYIDVAYEKHHRTLCLPFVMLFTINSIAGIVMHITGYIDIFKSNIITDILLMAFTVYALVSMTYEIVRFNNKKAKQTMISLAVPIIAGLIELIKIYSLGLYMEVGKTFQFGLIFFVLLFTYFAMRNINIFSENFDEDYSFKKFVYKDTLTSGKNRAAYFDEVTELCGHMKSTRSFWLVICDLNGLKHINDDYGHDAGDVAIITVYTCICKAFGTKDRVYRLGSDKFICILTEAEVSDVDEALLRLKDLSHRSDMSVGFTIEIATGYDRYIPKEWKNYDEFYEHVDRKMRENKALMKSYGSRCNAEFENGGENGV